MEKLVEVGGGGGGVMKGRSIFDLEHFLLERSGLGYSCFLNKDPSYVLNQKYSRILKNDWLSSAGRFEH